MSNIWGCDLVTYDSIQWNEYDHNIVQMTFNGYPVNIDYSSSTRFAILSVHREIEGWQDNSGIRYYKCSGESAPINAFMRIFGRDPSVIYSGKKYTIEMVYRGDKDDVKNNFFSTKWRDIAMRWEALQLDVWTADACDEDMELAKRMREENLIRMNRMVDGIVD
jgi:hypothetical protein